MRIEVWADGWLTWTGGRVRAALGRNGIADVKREGDGRTPAGLLPLRRVLYRADRMAAPRTALDCSVIGSDTGWSDDPADPAYNTLVTLPHAWRHETLWRDDEIYDIVVPLGYNDDPVAPGVGSAIFLHIARPDYRGTEGCVAVRRHDLLTLLRHCGTGSQLNIRRDNLGVMGGD